LFVNSVKRALINCVLFAVTLAANTLGAAGVINGLSQKEISDRYLTLITPAPFTFSIWSVLYALLTLSVLAMLLKSRDAYFQRAAARISPLFQLSCLLNTVWIIVFSYGLIELSALLILALAVTLTLLCRGLLQVQENGRWLLPLSFGLYAGWLLIAAVVNVSAALVKLNRNGFGLPASAWAAAMLIIAGLLVLAIQWATRCAPLSLPAAWAYWGIHQFLRAAEGFGGQYPELEFITLAGVFALAAGAIVRFYRNQASLLPSAPGLA